MRGRHGFRGARLAAWRGVWSHGHADCTPTPCTYTHSPQAPTAPQHNAGAHHPPPTTHHPPPTTHHPPPPTTTHHPLPTIAHHPPALSMPMPNAMVATTTGTSSACHLANTCGACMAAHAGRQGAGSRKCRKCRVVGEEEYECTGTCQNCHVAKMLFCCPAQKHM